MKTYCQPWIMCIGLCFITAASANNRDCTQIVSSLERLGCFDQVAQTPIRVPEAVGRATQPLSTTHTLLQINELQRRGENLSFVMSIDSEPQAVDQQRVMISAPALGVPEPRPYLAISCQSDISHLQLVLSQPVERHSVLIQLLVDDQPVAASRSWRVLEEGRVIDAGRGLPAVDLIKRLGGSRIRVHSDEPQLQGLSFDARGLVPLIAEERKACHW